MDFSRNSVRWPLALLVVVVVLSVAAMAPRWVGAVPQQQAATCTWKSIGNSGKDLTHVGGAMDTDVNHLYLYGGLNKDMEVRNDAERANLTGAALSATHGNLGPSGSPAQLFGAGAAYRSKLDDSAVWYVAGMGDPKDGTGTTTVQRYTIKTNVWDRPSVAGSFSARAFASAEWDPVHDVIWVTGGIANCKIDPDVLEAKSCNSKPLATAYISFDPATGNPSWNTLTGGDLSLYAHTMVYDSVGKRMLVYGGTTDIQSAKNQLRVLDLSDPDPAKAKWVSLSTSGTAPSIYFHGAAYDTQWNWMVTYGGVTKDFIQGTENANTKTMALNLAVTPPQWVDLKPSGSPGQKIGATMVYDPKHKASIIALGRQAFVKQSSGTPVPPAAQKPSKGTFGLECNVPQPTATRPGGVTPTTPVPVTPGGGPKPTPTLPPPQACPGLDKYVPAAVIANALANPSTVQGWGQLCNPNVPATEWNPWRGWLSMQRPVPYDPLFNGLVYKCGCP